MINPKKLLRPIRLVILAAVVISMGLFWRNRPSGFSMSERDHSMEPVYYAGARLAVREIDADFAIERGTDVLYAIGTTAYFGRVRGLPGDQIGATGGYLTVNDEPVKPIPLPGQALGTVPEGKLCILNVNPGEKVFPDSRTHGFIPRGQVRAIILYEIK